MKLSGGQQQRIAIARAMLGNPEILIFDEATSHLDAIAEQEVQEAIERVSQDRTVIVIAHRLSTIRQADHIVVLEEGRIVEQGSHESLVREQGRYVHLVGHAESAR
jgi:ATP-binding cassette subfamily B protein